MQVLRANFVRMSSIQVAANMSTATNVWKPLSVQYVGMNTFQMKLFPTICTLVLNRILHHENCMACGPCTRERECMCSPTAIVFTRNAQFSLASKRLVMGCIYILLYLEFLHQLLIDVYPLNFLGLASTPFQLLLIRALNVGKASFGVEPANQTSRRGVMRRQQ